MHELKTIVLASASPWRKGILEKTGLSFTVDASGCDEEIVSTLSPHTLARRLSRQKAFEVASRYKAAIVIAADTFIVLGRRIFGKPRTAAAAKRMLRELSGKKHLVITGFTIIDSRTKKRLTRSIETTVYFKKLTPGEINGYIRSGEPIHKAGAYAIQGIGAAFVRKIDGDFYNVVGLPLNAVVEGLREFGIDVVRGNTRG